ncbi:MAG: hypothetical protein K1X73_03615 [Bacteroidia bacterium]|nr:hypothetical protein [Bacteroidia bacterium]HMY13781.1 hypothetical protein [Bacteroidia bacterium]HNF41008.1 hypothetical protein [Bacteroidia bacterium]HNH65688.1 hypothetical protein [Bacteroidia bacterium]HNI30528.1 hypothetical protein [Bacteroidia bacterium]
MIRLSLVFFLFLSVTLGYGQSLSNLRIATIGVNSDTLQLDSLSIVPGSFHLIDSVAWDISCIKVLYEKGILIINKSCKQKNSDSLRISYRVFPVNFSKPHSNRNLSVIKQKYSGQYNPFAYDNAENNSQSIFNFDGLNKSGSISRGISFGNNQDVIVNSGLNLQLSGTLSDRVEILAAITDNNIPIQPEGNTQQLQEFDKVFVQLSRDSTRLIAGDFEISKPYGYFMNMYKKAQGAMVSSSFFIDQKSMWVMKTTDAAAISKGKFARNVFNGMEANQGPYRLTGAENETYIIVLSGTEKIYLNGILLTRGKENDYVIDYNTAQITFSARRLINKDSRIVAEFQYSDKNYVRTLLYSSNIFESKWAKFHVNYFTEQDNKNQPLFQDLNEDKRQVLANAGDNLQNAYFLNADSVGFNRNEVLYQKDSITIDSIQYIYFTYSIDSTRAFYRLGFSNVGQGRGNYRLLNSNVNGKVYEWIAPVNGQPQGHYEPVRLLIAPRRQQLLTVGGDVALSKNTNVSVEGAFSKNDVNLFSRKDKSNDVGYALHAALNHSMPVSKQDSSWKWVSVVSAELTDRRFRPLENYRDVEFVRDWNLTSAFDTLNETFLSINTGLEKNVAQNIFYQLKYFTKGNQYKGLMNMISSNYNWNKYFIQYNGSLLNTTGAQSNTVFLRSYVDGGKSINKLKVGYRQENERNKMNVAGIDSLMSNSFGHDKAGIYFTSADTGKWSYKAEASRRWDYRPSDNNLKLATTADQADADVAFIAGRGKRITLGSTYRTILVNRKEITTQKKDESFLGKLEIALQFLNGGITSNTYYEVGAGQEQRQAYSFIKVAAGAGVFEWNDYNGNGIAELNEFEVAAFQDRAEYIKIFTPTNDYVRIQTNQLSEVIGVNPSAFIKNKQGKTKLINRFALQSALRFDNKLLSGKWADGLNPFGYNINDTSLLITNSTLRNTLFFNRSSSVFAADFNYDNISNKSLLANGTEGRNLTSWLLNTRTYFKRVYGVTTALKYETKQNSSVFTNRNYEIAGYAIEPRFSVQPGTVFRTTLIYKYQDKQNVIELANEHATITTIGAECKYSSFKNGVASLGVNIISIGYNADVNSPLAFEMLEGLKKGRNYTWEISLQKNLTGNLQINIGYNGRKPQGDKIIHTANVQARAIF